MYTLTDLENLSIKKTLTQIKPHRGDLSLVPSLKYLASRLRNT